MSASAWTCAKRPDARRTGPSQYASVSTWWIPSCMIGPPGLRSRCARHAPGLKVPGSDMFASASTTRPSAPSSSSCFTRRAAPSRRNAWPTISVTPASAHARRIRSPASTLSAIGFSTNTWRPRSAHASACSSCTSFGVASTTPSTPGCSIASSRLAAGSQPKRSANSPRFASSLLKHVDELEPGALGGRRQARRPHARCRRWRCRSSELLAKPVRRHRPRLVRDVRAAVVAVLVQQERPVRRLARRPARSAPTGSAGRACR